MSKKMNASAFSCGDRSVCAHPVGNGNPGAAPVVAADDEPDATCMSENTTLPHFALSGASTGVVNWRSCTLVSPNGFEHGCTLPVAAQSGYSWAGSTHTMRSDLVGSVCACSV